MGRSAGNDSGRSVFGGPPPVGGSRGSLREPAGRVGAIWDWWAWRNGSLGGSGGWFQGVGAEFAQRVEAAPRELARDRQRRAGVREPARLERQVVGAVGAGGSSGCLG